MLSMRSSGDEAMCLTQEPWGFEPPRYTGLVARPEQSCTPVVSMILYYRGMNTPLD